MRERVNEFTPELRLQVKQEQGFKCALCGTKCNGHDLQVHHKVPVSMGGSAEAENAVALCNKPRICHEIFDQLALKHGIFYDDVRMEMGREYIIGIRTDQLPPSLRPKTSRPLSQSNLRFLR